MIPKSYWIDEHVYSENSWVVDGLISPHINAISGQPKVGKSTLVTQIALAVVNQTTVLDKTVSSKSNKVAWMGYDAGWNSELKTRCGDNAKNAILLQPGLRSLNTNDWSELGRELESKEIGLLVIDHLYGFAGHLNLNENQEANKVINCLNEINIVSEIPIILIAQATKHSHSGAMAHSNILKSAARVLIEMSGTSKSGKRTLNISGNEIPAEKITLNLSPTQVEIIQVEDKTESKQKRDYQANLDRAKRFFERALPGQLTSISNAAPIILTLGYSRTPDGARKMLQRWKEKKLIQVSENEITPGENYFT
jgi:predicted ATP-dependent serine protease